MKSCTVADLTQNQLNDMCLAWLAIIDSGLKCPYPLRRDVVLEFRCPRGAPPEFTFTCYRLNEHGESFTKTRRCLGILELPLDTAKICEALRSELLSAVTEFEDFIATIRLGRADWQEYWESSEDLAMTMLAAGHPAEWAESEFKDILAAAAELPDDRFRYVTT